MKPVSSRSVVAVLMARRSGRREALSAGRPAPSLLDGGPALAAKTLLQDALVLTQRQLQLFVEVGRLGQALTIRPNDLRAPPEVDAIFVADTVAEEDEAGEELGVHAVQHLDRVGAAKRSAAGHHPTPGTAADVDQVIRPVGRQDADRRVVPEILANEQAHTSKAGVE